MKKILSLFVIVSLVFPLGALAKFSDVPDTNQYANEIMQLESNGIVTGDSFSPDELIKRGEFDSWLLKFSGFNQENYEPKTSRRFSDVDLNYNPFSPYVYRLLEIGAIKGPTSTNTAYKPKIG